MSDEQYNLQLQAVTRSYGSVAKKFYRVQVKKTGKKGKQITKVMPPSKPGRSNLLLQDEQDLV